MFSCIVIAAVADANREKIHKACTPMFVDVAFMVLLGE